MRSSSRRNARWACWRRLAPSGRCEPARRRRAAKASGLRGFGVVTVIFMVCSPSLGKKSGKKQNGPGR
jgi:hypothetical protein